MCGRVGVFGGGVSGVWCVWGGGGGEWGLEFLGRCGCVGVCVEVGCVWRVCVVVFEVCDLFTVISVRCIYFHLQSMDKCSI